MQSSACTAAPHQAGALAANAAREGAEVKGAVDAANAHRRHGLSWLKFIEVWQGRPTGQGRVQPLRCLVSAGAAVRSGAEPQASDTRVQGMVRRRTCGRAATLLRESMLGAAVGAKPSTHTRAAKASRSCEHRGARCSESHANRIAGIEETGCLARARGQEGAAALLAPS